MIDCLIFSKDRPCQLDLLLRSIKDNFKEIQNIKILYLATNEDFEMGYCLTQTYHQDVLWIKETNFIKNTLDIFNGFNKEFVLNFVDDEVVIRNNSIEPALKFLRLNDTHGVSIRMAPHIDYCYTADSPDIQPNLIQMNIDGTMMYRWEWDYKSNQNTNWAYPSCINSHIYKRKEFVKYISMINFTSPNNLEGNYNLIRSKFNKYMACFEQSKSVNIANNLIQTGTNRHGQNLKHTVEALNAKYLSGKRLSTKPFYNMNNKLATFEKDYEWIN